MVFTTDSPPDSPYGPAPRYKPAPRLKNAFGVLDQIAVKQHQIEACSFDLHEVLSGLDCGEQYNLILSYLKGQGSAGVDTSALAELGREISGMAWDIESGRV